MKKALTLGELLITIGIIGVIAILVLPGFLKDYHNKLYVTKLKKVYEMLDVAINQACIDNNVSYFSQTPYVMEGTNPSSGKSYQQDFIDNYFKAMTNQPGNPFSEKYGYINGSTTTPIENIFDDNSAGAKLAGGEAIALLCGSGKLCYFYVDVNSKDAPNIGGRDMFIMKIDSTKNRIYDFPSKFCAGDTENNSLNDLMDAATGKIGTGCLTRIIEDNWEMRY